MRLFRHDLAARPKYPFGNAHGSGQVAAQNGDGGAVDPEPVVQLSLAVAIAVELEGAEQRVLAFGGRVGGQCEILVRAREQAERFLVVRLLPGKLGQDGLGATGRAGAGEREGLPSTQDEVPGVMLQSLGGNVIGQQRRIEPQEGIGGLSQQVYGTGL